MQCNDFRELNIRYSFYFDHFPLILFVHFLCLRSRSCVQLFKQILQLKQKFYMLSSKGNFIDT